LGPPSVKDLLSDRPDIYAASHQKSLPKSCGTLADQWRFVCPESETRPGSLSVALCRGQRIVCNERIVSDLCFVFNRQAYGILVLLTGSAAGGERRKRDIRARILLILEPIFELFLEREMEKI
jgi:hypothetical protein